MLSIKPLASAQAAKDYYTEHAEYYAQDATAVRWLGRGCQYLNLSDNVDANQFMALLEGKLLQGQQLQNLKGEHRPGFDMTFSAPKSLSVLVGLDIAPELLTLHDKAVEHALSTIEAEFAETRINRKGEISFEKTDNLVVASFRHPSSRAQDPAIHTHCVTMNMTFLNGEAKSLASDSKRIHGVVEQIQNNAHYCGLLYRQHLGNSLKEAGFSLRATGDGLFEIEGVPERVLQSFSQRRNAIESLMEEEGWEGAKQASQAALLTREGKEVHDLAQLKAEWKERAKALDFDANTFQKETARTQSTSLFANIKTRLQDLLFHNKGYSEEDAAKACVTVAIETLSQRTAVFTERILKYESLKHSLIHEKAISQTAIHQAIQTAKNDQTLYHALCPETKQVQLTTPWLLTLEAESIARIENNKYLVKPIATLGTVRTFQKQIDETAAHPLTRSQKEAMQILLTSKDRYLAIQGYAGVAKTTMLSHARTIIEKEGYQLRGVTVASSAAHELQTKAGITSDVFPIVHQELKQAASGSLSKLLFIVDESSMLSSAQGHALMKEIERTSSRLILVGDKAQLPSINSGRLFGLTQEYGIQTVVMDEIVRQKNPTLLSAVKHASRGEVRQAMDKLTHIEEQTHHESRIQYLANHWLSLDKDMRKQTLLFAPTHTNRRDITTLIRSGLTKEGALQGEVYHQKTLKSKALEPIQQRFAANYQTGDVLRFNLHYNRHRIKPGEYYTIGTITKKHREDNVLPLTDNTGKTRNFPLSQLPQYKTTTAAFERVIEVYRSEMLPLQTGDQVLWTRNCKHEGMRNGERATLSAKDANTLTFTLENGQTLSLAKDTPALQHLDHGYVFTNYKVQGKDAIQGIGLMESHQKLSATLKNFYVQISRGVHNMILVTDNKEALSKAIERNVNEKKASLDILSSHQLINHEERFKPQQPLSIQPVINKKIQKEKELER